MHNSLERLSLLLVGAIFFTIVPPCSQGGQSNAMPHSETKQLLNNIVMMNQKFGFAIHGGAGTIVKSSLSPEMEQAYRSKLNEALLAGYEILRDGGSSLDAVESAIKLMEDSPLFNASKGAVYTSGGTIELDASIMDGKTLKAGAVAAVKHIKNPIVAARIVMEQSPHVLLVGDGAEDFAKQKGVELVSEDYFKTDRRWNELQKAKEKENRQADQTRKIGNNQDSEYARVTSFGTVGAVALDKHGNLAAATSTGGMTNKKVGRVGDSPIIGAGTYANNRTCAVSGTGDGEYFMRALVAYDVSALMQYKGMSLKSASNLVIEKVGKLGGSGGIIAIDHDGNIAMPFDTEGMYRGYVGDDGKLVVKIYKD